MLLEMNVKLRRGHFDLTTQLSVNDNSIGVFGKSGAGKSTILELIAGTLQPQSGSIRLDGKILFDSKKGIVMPREQRPIGAVLQIDALDLKATVHEILLSAYQRIFKPRRLLKLDAIIQLLALGPLLTHSVQSLSAGERQRVALARALIKSPQLLLLDETFATIGQDYRMQLLPFLKTLQDELNLPVVYASQSLGEILELTDKLIILEQGKVLRHGSLREFAKQQGLLRYLGIRQVDNLLLVTILSHDQFSGSTLGHSYGVPLALPFRPHFAAGEQIQVSVRANDVALSLKYLDGISIQNQLKGRVCALIPNGESIIVQVDCGGVVLAEITPKACRDMDLKEGDSVYCLIKTHSITILTEMHAQTNQRVVSHGDGHYYLSTEFAAIKHFKRYL